MHSAIVFIPYQGTNQKWDVFATQAKSSVDKGKGTRMLSENCWLFPLHSALPQFSGLLAVADRNSIQYEVLFLSDEPRFISSSPSS